MTTDNTDIKKDNSEEAIKTVLFILFPALWFAYHFALTKATDKKIWRFVETPFRLMLLGTCLSSVSLYFFQAILHRMVSLDTTNLIWLVLGFYLFQIPLIPVVLKLRLKSIVSNLSLSRIEIVTANYIKSALIEFGFEKAKRIAKSYGKNTPIFSDSGKSVIGLNAHVNDYRFRTLRKRYPRRNVLTHLTEKDLVISQFNPSSPSHQLVIGETGSGKSRLLSRMALAGLADGWKVVIIDLKGGAEELQLYSNLGKLLPNKSIRVKRFPEQPFNFFNGSQIEIQKKVLSLLPPLTNTPADFYIRRMSRGIKSVINEELPPPSSFEEILLRIKNGVRFGSSDSDRIWFASKNQGQTIADIVEADVAQCLYPLRSNASMKLDVGSSWDTSWDICIFSLDGSVRDEVIVGDAILTDFDLHLRTSSRHLDNRNYLVIIDEAGVFNSIGGSRSLTSLIARSRSSGVGLVIASQTLLGLGSIGDEIAESTPIRWIGRLSNPQQMVNLVGTEDVLEATYSYENGKWSEPTAARSQKAYIVDPDLARRLETFYWNLNISGKHLWVYAPPLRFDDLET
jgi:hypothetical protein